MRQSHKASRVKSSGVSLGLSPRGVLLTLIVIIGVLITASTLAGAAWYFLGGGESSFLLVQLFWVDSESNIPTLYSCFALLVSALLLGIIASIAMRQGEPHRVHWAVLSAIFVYLALDEGARIHERSVEPLRALLQLAPVPASAFLESGPVWVAAGALAVVIFVIWYVPFLIHLPAHIRNLMILAGGSFVAGALGFEVVSHLHAVVHGKDNATYALLATIEELLEMLGVAIFIYTLLLYIGSRTERFEVRIEPEGMSTRQCGENHLPVTLDPAAVSRRGSAAGAARIGSHS